MVVIVVDKKINNSKQKNIINSRFNNNEKKF